MKIYNNLPRSGSVLVCICACVGFFILCDHNRLKLYQSMRKRAPCTGSVGGAWTEEPSNICLNESKHTATNAGTIKEVSGFNRDKAHEDSY